MTIAFLNIGTQEMILIVIVILLLFGGKKLPELARGLGRGIRDFKDASEGIKREISDQINNFEKDLDVTVEDKPKTDAYTAGNSEAVEKETTEEEEVVAKKAPVISAPENTFQYDPGAHPVDETEYYKYGYTDHFAEEKSATESAEEQVSKNKGDQSTDSKQA